MSGIVSVAQQIDFNGTMGKMLAAVLPGVAEMEQETHKERQRAGIDVAKKRGKYRGRRPGTTKAKLARAAKHREKGLTAEEMDRIWRTADMDMEDSPHGIWIWRTVLIGNNTRVERGAGGGGKSAGWGRARGLMALA